MQCTGGGWQITTIVYSYDPLYRLKNASYTGSTTAAYSYTYDSVGNVTAYDPYGRILAQTGQAMGTLHGTTYAFTGEQFDSSTGLLYLRACYYNPNLRLFMGRDPWRGSVWRPNTLHGLSYVGNNPVNFVDPAGLRPRDCTPHLTTGRCIPHYQSSSGRASTQNLFNFKVLPGQPGSEIIAYIQVTYRDMPWFEYARPGITNSPRQIPVRHSLNLLEENPGCDQSLEEAKKFYTSSAFTIWEVNARNIVIEMKGAIKNQEELSGGRVRRLLSDAQNT